MYISSITLLTKRTFIIIRRLKPNCVTNNTNSIKLNKRTASTTQRSLKVVFPLLPRYPLLIMFEVIAAFKNMFYILAISKQSLKIGLITSSL